MTVYAVVIPTLNAGNTIDRLLETLEGQSLPPKEIIVVDSQSDDGTASLAAQHDNVRVLTVKRQEFDHGGTRDMAIRACDAPFVVMLTQDALPIDEHCMEKLLAPMVEDERVVAVCGRQVAYPDARAQEKLIRNYRYPQESDAWGAGDVERKGISAYLLSDACTAYRRSAYEAVGGFTHPIPTNEDMLIAAVFLDTGYRLAFAADARVFHSHNYRLSEEYRRNKKIGRFLKQYGHRFHSGETGEGLRLVKYVTIGLLKQGRPFEVFYFWLNCAARLLGNRIGKMSSR